MYATIKKRQILRKITVMLFLPVFFLSFVSCTAPEPAAFDFDAITTYRDIPGVTQD